MGHSIKIKKIALTGTTVTLSRIDNLIKQMFQVRIESIAEDLLTDFSGTYREADEANTIANSQ